MRRIARALRWVLGGLLALEIVYLAAAVLLVQSGQVERWLNKNPEKRTIRFESAWSLVPFLAHVVGLEVVNQGRGDQIGLVVDRATAFVDPVELLGRRVHVMGLRARGVEFRLRKRPKSLEEAKAREAVVAPIEGIPFEPYTGPPEAKKKKPGWTIVFTGARIRDIRELWIDTVRLRGEGDVAASVTVGPGPDRRVSIRSADVRVRDAELAIAGNRVVQDLDLIVEGRMEPFFTKQTRGKALLPLVTAEVDLSGRVSTAEVLNRHFGKADWLEFTSGPGRVSAEFEIERGQVRPGGHVELEEGALGARFAGFIVEGQATARLETHAAKQGNVPDAEVSVAFTEYGMRRRVDGPPALKGEALLIQARSSADLQGFPPGDFDGRLELGNAEFPDLAFVNGFIPRGAGLTVKGGRAVVDGHFETGKDAACLGSVVVTTTGLVLEAGGVETAGDAELAIQVPAGNLDDLRFSLDGTRLALDHFAFTSKGSAEDAPDFRGRFALTEGDLDLGETPGIDTRLELALSDTRPLVAFLSRDKPLAGWKERLLTISEITGRGDLELTKETATFRHAEVSGGKVGIEGRVFIDDQGPFGKVLGRYGILKVGIGLEGAERDLKVLGVGNWYKKDDVPGMPPVPQAAGETRRELTAERR